MTQKIRTSRISKIIASYLAIQMVISVVQPTQMYALTGGPSQPEFNSFTPIGTSDMVNLSSGDFNYNIPVMDVGGYPLNLAYDSGVGMDQEASWVGLGWNLNVGQITRDVRGVPDDFKGDEMIYKNHMKENKTVGVAFNINPQFFGLGDMGLGVSAGLTVQHNNYTGLGFQPSYGVSYALTDHVSVGASLSSSTASGVTASPSVSLSSKNLSNDGQFNTGLSAGIGIGYNSRQGLTSFNMNSGVNFSNSDKETKNTINWSQGGKGSISFVNNTFTPAKRVAYKNSNLSFAVSLGLDAWGVDAEVGVTGFGITQKIKDGVNHSKAFGYNNTHLAPENAILDFNREKEDVISKNTLSLSPTNYTYDIYQIQGQGIGGMFRPFRGQVGHVFSQFVQDQSGSDSFGGEAEGGAGWHVGLDVTLADGFAQTGKWETPVASYFSETDEESILLEYEQVYYKTIGEYTVDPEADLLDNRLGGNKPVRIGIGGTAHAPGRYAENIYYAKEQSPNAPLGTPSYQQININEPIKREERELRNTSVTPVQFGEAGHDPFINENNSHSLAKNHHIAGYKIMQTNGATYLYGETVYNTKKEEETFAIEGTPDHPDEGTISYNNQDNIVGNGNGVDHYFNSIKTPAYAHTYLLTGILSADYEDLTGNGISDDDLGAYTKFNYQTVYQNYNWNIPYQSGKASYNQGLNSNPKDDKASVVSGTKELKYIHTIETKTHVAYFRLEDRLDGKESEGGNKHMKNIDKIFLYTKQGFNQLVSDYGNLETVPTGTLAKRAIKVAHFEYDYSLCSGVPNSSQGGKLTLKSLYFTYKDSYMGKYTPYKFNYEGLNPDYSLKAYDIWGNYKPNEADNYNIFNNPLSPQEFPFVQQDDKELQDQYASAWSLTSIDLPSGGRIDLTYETDDYQFVQDKEPMRMFKIAGVAREGESPGSADLGDDLLYNHGNFSNDAKYLIVELPEISTLSEAEFKEKYLREHYNKPIFFRFLLNMSKEASNTSNSSNDFDYVEGYFKIDTGLSLKTFTSNGKFYGAIPMKFSDLEGGINGGKDVNPISKAGWYFGQKYLPRKVYGLPLYTDASIKSIMNQLKSDFGAIDEIIRGPNAKLRNQRRIAKRYVPEKSWIRLLEPNDRKLGGGVRVQKIEMYDNWDKMMYSTNEEYKQFYGQEYSYNLEDGSSSGVATYEPNMSKENPFVEPFYNKDESLVAPREVNYKEKPFGESFFPSPTVTYSRVSVKNLSRAKQEGGQTLKVKKHATGKVVTEFYTSKDFPTIADYTELDGPGNFYSNDNDVIGQGLSSLLGLNVKVNTELTLSQGFVVQTNDMNGKEKRQSVYSELGEFISGAEYKYSVNPDGNLNNYVPMITKNGEVINDREVGVHYDVVNDFYENYTYTNMSGMQGNVVAIPVPFIPPVWVVPSTIPQSAEHTNILRTATTTKVIHRTGIMTEKIAYDLGARVSTKNMAWDAKTGEVLLTETTNEYKDNYYNFNFPAYWANPGMGLATNNVGIKGALQKSGSYYQLSGYSNLREIFTEGDELVAQSFFPLGIDRFWVVGFNAQQNAIQLMDRNGEIVDQSSTLNFYIDRSGFRNIQSASMASVTLMENPIADNQISKEDFDMNETVSDNPRIVNASTLEYTDFWSSQCEANIPKNRFLRDIEGNEIYDVDKLCLNPYIYNIKGDYKPVRSYTYLTGRNLGDGLGVRNQGFFNEFTPYYVYDNDAWVKNPDAEEKWTYASEVTQYSPFGVELENRDALGRYSAAQYGYGYTLPVAVSSNSSYAEMGYDGFEDYDEGTTGQVESHFGFHDASGVQLSTERSHTGIKSIKVGPGSNVKIKKNLEECSPVGPPAE